MKDKDKIKSEIERLLNKEWKWGSSIEAKFRCEAYRELLEFIDSLPEEPISSVWHGMSEDAENGRNIIIIDPKGFYGAVLRKGGSQLKNHNKERYVKWAYIDDVVNLSNVERIVKDWKEPVSDDLDAITREYSLNISSELYNILSPEMQVLWKKETEQHFLNGIKRGQEQMMKNAVDGLVICDENLTRGYRDILFKFPEELKVGDKVKMIIIKEDEK